ncbi:MAG: hypothetical protein E6772_00630 [Dysgonomonas sp.]|nr:hypothetical protein [Dysgonomonas sp.]
MNNDKINKLEKNDKLKKKVFGKNIWKNYAMLPPSLLLFIGIFGLIYLLNLDLLISLYSIPFVILFILGTIWFKATKKYLINKKIAESQIFIVCLAIPLIKERKRTILVFSTGKNRNNKYYLEKEKKDLLEQQTDYININDITPTDKDDILLTPLPATKKFQGTNSTDEYWLIYTGNEKPYFLTSENLRKY